MWLHLGNWFACHLRWNHLSCAIDLSITQDFLFFFNHYVCVNTSLHQGECRNNVCVECFNIVASVLITVLNFHPLDWEGVVSFCYFWLFQINTLQRPFKGWKFRQLMMRIVVWWLILSTTQIGRGNQIACTTWEMGCVVMEASVDLITLFMLGR